MTAAAVREPGRVEDILGQRRAPLVFGVLTVLLIGWLWGSLNPLPWVYDEAAYLLQAQIFAAGEWAAPGRPLPEFFEQIHVFVTPRLVPRYPPGHALLMVPGIWLGATALMPLLFSGLTGALVFGLARRLANPWVGLLTWLIWITAPEELYLRPSFMSQTSSTLVWLLAWTALARWQATGQRRMLVTVAMLGALAGLIRPVTAIAFLIPVGLVILKRVIAEREWRALLVAIAAALPVAAIGPGWSLATTGRAFPTPYSEYSRVYTPWNMPGFQVDTSPPLRPEIPAISRFRREWLPLHQSHRIERLPAILFERVRGIVMTVWGGPGGEGWAWRYLLVPMALLGLLGLPAPARVVGWCAGSIVLIMLSLASRPLWTVYYLEVFPWFALVTALGVWRVARWTASRAGREGLAAWLVGIGIVASFPRGVDRLIRARDQQVTVRLSHQELAQAIATIPGKAVVFVAAGPAHRPYESLVTNEPDLEGARVWVVHDRGDDNRRLIAVAAGRKAYRWDPGTGRLTGLATSP